MKIIGESQIYCERCKSVTPHRVLQMDSDDLEVVCQQLILRGLRGPGMSGAQPCGWKVIEDTKKAVAAARARGEDEDVPGWLAQLRREDERRRRNGR